jgi:aminotransferase
MKRVQPDIRALARLIPPSGNLVQGQNEVALNPGLAKALDDVVGAGLNHYSFFEGVADLRRAVAEKIRLHNKVDVDPEAKPLELIITPGATGALVAIAQTFLQSFSAMVFEPYYPYHKKILSTFGAGVVTVKLEGEDLTLDLDEVRRICSEASARTEFPLKAILVCSPANPTGRSFTKPELEWIIQCAEEFNLFIISDEVYEHFTAAASDHISPAALPGGFERTITVNSFSKSWAVSGWRLGFAYGPGELVGKLSAAGNVIYVCTPTPLQYALARVLLADPAYYDRLRSDFTHKRSILAEALQSAGFKSYDSRSTFYVWTRIPERFADASELNDFLIKEAGVAGVPGSAFIDDPDSDLYMRFCVARENDMLEAAAARLLQALG